MGEVVAERERVSRALMPPSAAPDGSLAAALQRAVERRGVSIHWLQRALVGRGATIDPATLISWRAGRLVPGPEHRSTVALLEQVLGLPTGDLTALLAAGDPHRRPRLVAEAPGPGTVVSPGIQRALDALGFEGPPGLVETRIAVHLEVDDRGLQARTTRRSTWTARRPGADRFPVVTVLPVPVDGRPRLSLLSGCSEGPHYTDLAEGVFATSVTLDRPLEPGQTAETEHRIDLPGTLASDSSYEHQLREPVERVSVTIGFHPDRLPSVVYGYSVVGPGGSERTHALPMVDGAVTHTLRDFGPGVVGVRWRW